MATPANNSPLSGKYSVFGFTTNASVLFSVSDPEIVESARLDTLFDDRPLLFHIRAFYFGKTRNELTQQFLKIDSLKTRRKFFQLSSRKV